MSSPHHSNDQTVYLKRISLTQSSLTVPIRVEILQIRYYSNNYVSPFAPVIQPMCDGLAVVSCITAAVHSVIPALNVCSTYDIDQRLITGITPNPPTTPVLVSLVATQ